MVGHRQGVEEAGLAGGVNAERVPVRQVHERLVEGDPQRDPVAEAGGGEVGVVGEAGGGVPGEPAAAVLQRLRQVPVEERDHRVDAAVQQHVHQPVVEGEAGGLTGPGPVGLHPRPGDREAVAPTPSPPISPSPRGSRW